MRQTLFACLLLILPATAFAGEPIDTSGLSLHMRQGIEGAVAVDLANDETTVVVAVDEGTDGLTDYLFTTDLAGELKEPLYYRFGQARVLYILGEGRLQVFAPADGVNLLLGPEGAAPLDRPEPELAATPILWLETKSIAIYPLEGPTGRGIEEVVERQRNAKAEARATRERLRRERQPIVRGTQERSEAGEGTRSPFGFSLPLCPEGQGEGGVNCDVGGCGTDVCGIGGCAPPRSSCTEPCAGEGEFCCGGCYLVTGEAHCECLETSTYCGSGCEPQL